MATLRLQRCATGAIDERVNPETVLSILNYYQAPEALEYRSHGPFLEEGLCILVSLPEPKAVPFPQLCNSMHQAGARM